MKKIIESKYFKYVLLAVGIISIYLHFGEFRIPIMMFVWPFCFLYLFRKAKTVLRFLLLILVFFIQAQVFSIGAMGEAIADAVAGLHSFIVWIIVFVVDAIFYKKVNKVSKVLPMFFFPVWFALVFIVENNTFALMNAGQYTLAAYQGFLQSASIIGYHGMGFITMLFASILFYFVDNYGKKNAVKPLIAYLICFAVIVTAGELRLSTEKYLGDDTLRVAMSTTSQECDFTFEGDFASTEVDTKYVYSCMEEAASCKASIICFGEECVYLDDVDVDAFVTSVCKKAAELNIYVILPMEVGDTDNDVEGLGMNLFFFINDKGEVEGIYEKSMLIPIMEEPDYVPGNGEVYYNEVQFANGKTLGISGVICFDADHELFVSSMNDNTDILFVPSWTWGYVDPAHTDVMRLRAVENGVSLVNPSCCAKSAAVDWQGNTIALSDQNVTGIQHVTIADVPYKYNNSKTIYHYISYPLLYINCAAFIFLLVSGIVLCIKKGKKK